MTELSRLLTFMFKEDKEEILEYYEQLLDAAEDEQEMLASFGSPTKLAVTISRSYDRELRKLALSADSRAEATAPQTFTSIEPVTEEDEEESAAPIKEEAEAPAEEEAEAPVEEETEAPVEEETEAPVEEETEAPVEEETEAPVEEETEAPVEEETEAPVEEETEAPVEEETEAPAEEETEAPVEEEAEAPVEEEAEAPAEEEAEPTVVAEPTEKPLPEPTEEPTLIRPVEELLPSVETETVIGADEPEEVIAPDDSTEKKEPSLAKQIFVEPTHPEEPAKEPEEAPKLQRKLRTFPLIVYLIFAIPIGLALFAALLCVTVGLLAVSCCVGAGGIGILNSAFTGLQLMSDTMIVLGGGVVVLALGLLLVWFSVWLIVVSFSGLFRGLVALGRKLCVKEVAVNG